MITFVGAGPGAPDLITVRGKQYLEEAKNDENVSAIVLD